MGICASLFLKISACTLLKGGSPFVFSRIIVIFAV